MAKIFESKGYKLITGYVYGWGATAVIIGALFKIMHWPGAGVVLTIGMCVEAFIFFISAFEPPMEHYNWERVFPELGAGALPVAGGAVKPSKKSETANAPVAGGVVGAVPGIEEADVEKFRQGIEKFASTADHFADASVSVPEFARKITTAATSFERLGEKTDKAGELMDASLQAFTDGCSEIGKVLRDSTQNLTAQIKNNCDRLASTMEQSSTGFDSLSRMLEEQLGNVKSQAEGYTQQIAGVNKNVGALNALYELQVNETKECLESFRSVQGDMGEMLEHVSLGLDSTKLFRQEAQQLANNVASLNSIYGNMLSVVNSNN